MQLKIFLLSSSNLSFPLAKTAKSLYSTYTTKTNPSARSPRAFIRKPQGAECHLREKQSTYLSVMHCQKAFKKNPNNQQLRALQLLALPVSRALRPGYVYVAVVEALWTRTEIPVVLMNVLTSEYVHWPSLSCHKEALVARPCVTPLLVGICKSPCMGPRACRIISWILRSASAIRSVSLISCTAPAGEFHQLPLLWALQLLLLQSTFSKKPLSHTTEKRKDEDSIMFLVPVVHSQV